MPNSKQLDLSPFPMAISMKANSMEIFITVKAYTLSRHRVSSMRVSFNRGSSTGLEY
jgi:hypothetical protein